MIDKNHLIGRGRGFSLIELLVAITIGLFLIGGLLTLVQAMRRTNTNQGGLSNLQDTERMAMEIVTDVIQSTGYYTQPLINTAASTFTVPSANFPSATAVAGQALIGSDGTNSTITTRYATTGNDNVINCTGNTSTTAAIWTNQLSITTVSGVSYLTCTLWTNGGNKQIVPLIPNVTGLQVLYGVSSNLGQATNSVDAYTNATGVAAGPYWSQVHSVVVTLTFPNPLYGQPGQTQPTIQFQRVIDVMNKGGVTS
jgi:type IV pilus assembly protein PilW